MKISQPVLPGIHLASLRRCGPSNQTKALREAARYRQLNHSSASRLYGRYLPANVLSPSKEGGLSRQRIFTKRNTFYAFLHQVQTLGAGSQMEAVRHVQTTAAAKAATVPSSRTNAYSKARSKFPVEALYEIADHLASQTETSGGDENFLGGRRLLAADGTGLSMPDTPANQERWPQPSGQTEGCGHPDLRLVALVNLRDGMILDHAVGNQFKGEIHLFRSLTDSLRPGDIFLGDRLYGSWLEMHQARCMDIDMITGHNGGRKRKTAADAVKVLGDGDLLVEWEKPKHRPSGVTLPDWLKVPRSIPMRQITIELSEPGFRSKSICISTTLLDPVAYPKEQIAAAYKRRWEIEMMFDVMKSTLGIGILRCKSPEMIEKELFMHIISYNLLRLVIRDAMNADQIRRDVSFTAALQYIRNWLALQVGKPRFNKRKEIRELREAIRTATVPYRPNRKEPRVNKRRPKNYQFMTAPRAEMKETLHRNHYRASPLK